MSGKCRIYCRASLGNQLFLGKTSEKNLERIRKDFGKTLKDLSKNTKKPRKELGKTLERTRNDFRKTSEKTLNFQVLSEVFVKTFFLILVKNFILVAPA